MLLSRISEMSSYHVLPVTLLLSTTSLVLVCLAPRRTAEGIIYLMRDIWLLVSAEYSNLKQGVHILNYTRRAYLTQNKLDPTLDRRCNHETGMSQGSTCLQSTEISLKSCLQSTEISLNSLQFWHVQCYLTTPALSMTLQRKDNEAGKTC